MRRPVLLGLIAAIILVLGLGGYTVFWRIAAGRIEAGALDWAQAARQQGIDASWQGMRVGGYPFGFRIEMTGFHASDTVSVPAVEVTAPVLTATVPIWNPNEAALAAPDGLSAKGAALATLTAARADGTVAAGAAGGGWVWLRLDAARLETPMPLIGGHSKTAQLWLILPATVPSRHTDRNVALAADLRDVSVPVAVPALGKTIAGVAFGITVMGAIPSGPPRQAAAAWRDSGGTADLDHLDLSWGPLRIAASGTVALDRELQPIGSFSGAVGGVDALLKALTAAGELRPSDARLAGLALRLMERPGPDGKPQVATSFSIQNGEIFLGPARLGRMPHLDW
ncbi:MAG TPA: DUF2125 domain-containing protein [Stellaceae bacterium]|nr:DUF2125 domain-containing protein [Stellaceae bacterium]